jgi:hypothetical protein
MRRSLAIGLASLAALTPAATASADIFEVTQTRDRAGVCDDRCALREAVIAANLSSEASVIEVPPGVYELTLSGAGENGSLTGDLDLSDAGGELTLEGAGPAATVIDGVGDDRVLNVDDDEVGDPPVTIRKLAIRNGKSVGSDGGGILVATGRDLTIERSRIAGNRTKGTGSDGGGIEVGGSLLLDRSTISGNRAGNDGGGVSVNSGGDVEVSASTINANVAGSAENGGDGAGIYAPGGGSTTLSNSTISGNRGLGPSGDGGAIYATAGGATVDIIHSTIAFNETSFDGGGLYVSLPSLFVTHSIVARNNAGDDGDNCEGTAPAELATSLENQDDCGFTLPDANTGLRQLADNGGPTRTHALKASSDAVGAGTDGPFCTPPIDQRGQPRPADDCDLGAYQR